MQELVQPELKQNISTREKFNRRPLLVGLCIFLLCLSITLLFHFTGEPPKRTLCFDARQYIFDAGRIAEFILALCKRKFQPELVSDQGFLTSILADGPAFPTIFAGIFALLGHAPGIEDCRLIEIIQSTMHAMSACSLFTLSYLLTGRLRLASFAGLSWGLYPAAIFWSGIFYTETTVILFTLLFLLALLQSKRAGFSFLAGVLAGVVALLKPALLPAAFLATLLSVRYSKRSLILALCGVALSLAPWMLYTRAMTGHIAITAQRFPAFNLAMGADTEVDACLVSPAPPLTTLFSRDNETPYAFPFAQWQYHTRDCLRLAAVKFSCLWSRQANDFRLKFFGISPAAQNYWHLFLLFGGLSGLGYSLLSLRSMKPSLQKSNLIIASFIFMGSHLSYVLFTPAARYGMTSMPFLILFASMLPLFISKAKNSKQQFPLLSVCLSSLLLVFALVNGKSLSPVFNSAEFSHTLKNGERAMKIIDLSRVTKPSRPVYSILLLVDADENIEYANVRINDQPIKTKLQNIRYFDSTLYCQAFELRSLGYPSGIATDDFRHWRALSIPSSIINWSGENKIEIIQNNRNSIIYGDPQERRRRITDLHFFSVNSLCNSDSSTDLRVPSPITTGNVPSRSFINSAPLDLKTNTASRTKTNHNADNAGLIDQNDSAKSPTQNQLSDALRIRLAVVLDKPFDETQTKEADLITEQCLSPEKFDLYLQVPEINGVRASRASIKAARSMGATCNIPTLNASSHVRLIVEGELRGTKTGKAEVVVALQPDRHGTAAVLNMAPQMLNYTNEWEHFCIEDHVPTNILDDKKPQSLYMAVYPGPWLDFSGYTADKNCGTAEFRNLKFKISSEDSPDIAGRHVLFY